MAADKVAGQSGHHYMLERMDGVIRRGRCECGAVKFFTDWPDEAALARVSELNQKEGIQMDHPAESPAAEPAAKNLRRRIDREQLLRLGPRAYAQEHGMPHKSVGLLSQMYRKWGGADDSIGQPMAAAKPGPKPASHKPTLASIALMAGREAGIRRQQAGAQRMPENAEESMQRLQAVKRFLRDLAEII